MMSPANLALRFLLELAALAGWALWAWGWAEGGWRWPVSVSTCLCLALLWGVFAVPGDPSRSGHAPIPVPGLVRLILELAILTGGAVGLALAGHALFGLVLGGLIALHYGLSLPRLRWLLHQ